MSDDAHQGGRNGISVTAYGGTASVPRTDRAPTDSSPPSTQPLDELIAADVRTTLDALPSEIAVLDRTGTMLFVNRAWKQRCANDKPRDVWAGRRYLDVLFDDAVPEAELVREGITSVLRGVRDAYTFAHPCQTPDELRWLRVHVASLGDTRAAVMLTRVDITAEKAAQETLCAREGRLWAAHDVSAQPHPGDMPTTLQQRTQAILGAVAEGIHVLDRDGNLLFENPAAARAFGHAESAHLGKNVHDLIHHHRAGGSHYPKGECPIYRTLEDGETRRIKGEIFFRPDGSCFPVEYICAPLRDGRGDIDGVVVCFHDVTERDAALREAERTLRASEERMLRVFANAATGIAIATSEGVFVDANAAYCRMLGYSVDELRAFDMAAVTHPDDHAAKQDAWREILAGARESLSVEQRYLAKGGHVVWARVSVSLLRDARGGPLHLVAVSEDITEQHRAIEALQRKAGLLRIASRVGRLGAWSVRLPDGELIWSPETLALLEADEQTPPTRAQGWDFYVPAHRSAFRTAFQKCAEEGTPFDLELEIETIRGRHLWVRSMGEAQRDDQNAIIGVHGALQDLSDLKAVEQSLTRSEQRLRQLSDAMPIAVWTAMPDGFIDYANLTFTKLTGVTNDDLSGLDGSAWVSAIHPEDAPMWAEAWQHAVETVELFSLEFRIRRQSDGAYCWHLVRAVPIRDEQGVLVKWYGTAIDVHATRTTEERAKHLAAELASTLESITDVFFTLDRDLRIVYVNSEGARLTERDAGALQGVHLTEAFPPSISKAIVQAISLAPDPAMPVPLEIRHELRDAWYFGRAYPSPTGHAVYLRDETQTRRAREALRESEERFRLLARASHDAIRDWDLQSNVLWWNDGFEALFGYALHAGGKTIDAWAERIHPEDYPRVTSGIKEALQLGKQQWSSEYRFERVDGSHAFVLDRCHIIYDVRGNPVRMVGGMTDLTERRRSEERLAEQAELLEKAQDAILVRDLDGRIRYMNRRAEVLYGWDRETALGLDVRDLQFAQTGEDFARANEATVRLGEWTGDLEQSRHDGTKLIVEGRWTLLRGPDGAPSGVLAINTDVTERRRLEQQFLRAQRLESVGTLAGGIAHDLNNVLTPILFSAELLSDEETDPTRLADIDAIRTCAKRGSEMIAQLLSFARGYEGSRTDLSIHQLLQEVARIVRDTFPKDILCTLSTPADRLWTVQGDPSQLHQVLLNLCVNSRDAMPRGGSLRLIAENIHIDDLYAGMNPGTRAGSYVSVRIEDSGTGMPPDVLERVFEPFFTTKAQGKGTGLGLSTAHAIIKSHGGFIQVYSELGRGTRFRIYLPADPNASVAGRSVPEATSLPRGRGECVLVVDDEEPIRSMMERTLTRYGYRVLLACHGAEAIAIYVENREKIDVVLTDMAMPVMDGAALTAALHSIDPGIRVIGSSGLDENGKVAAAREAGVRDFVAKPYTAHVMLRCLRRVLEEQD